MPRFLSRKKHLELHFMSRIGWLRAGVLGANDGILSVASIMCGMAAGHASHEAILLGGLAGLVAGATSMAAGEYVSVSSQSDTEKSDLAREKLELETNPEFELEELAQIYVSRGLQLPLAREVAGQLMKHNALEAHARDELGISENMTARPLQAAFASAASFTVGGIFPLLIALVVAPENATLVITLFSLVLLAALGAVGARIGGVKFLKPTMRVLIWGAVSLGLTTLVGVIFGIQP